MKVLNTVILHGTSGDAANSSLLLLWGADGLVGTQSKNASNVVTSSYFLYDAQGNLAQTVNESGTVLPVAAYTAWGEVVPRANGTVPALGAFGYGAKFGYWRDSDSGLYLCTLRFYDPSNGRFVTRDPIRFNGGSNLFGYTGNDPANRTDPAGLKDTEPNEKWVGQLPHGPGTEVDTPSSLPNFRSPQHLYPGHDVDWGNFEKLKMRALDTDLLRAKSNHTNPDLFDYKIGLSEEDDRICLNGRWVTPGEFGNYAVGYGNVYAGGGNTPESTFGLFVVLAGGHADQATEGIATFFRGHSNRPDGYRGLLDPPQDQRWIAEGTRDALRDMKKE